MLIVYIDIIYLIINIYIYIYIYMTKSENICCNESYWTQIIRYMGIYHGDCTKEIIDGTCTKININKEKYNTDYFAKSFAFWKLFFIFFFLFAIGIINLITKNEKTMEYMTKNYFKFFIEFILLFLAFLLSTIFMYIIRLGELSLITNVTVIIFIFCIFKHLAFELSGLYRFNFGYKECKSTEHFGSVDTKDTKDTTDPTKPTVCDCEDNFFSGLFWNGLKYQGVIVTILLILFFGASLIYPKLTEKFFNYNIKRWQSIIFIFVIIIAPFIMGYYMDEMPLFKPYIILECSPHDYITKILNGCAFVSIAFMTFSTLILPVIAFIIIRKQKFMTGLDLSKKDLFDSIKPPYNDCYWKGKYKRLLLTFIESVVIFFIFAFAEAGIDAARTGHQYMDIIQNINFWKKSFYMTFVTIIIIQYLLEYSNWFKAHMFNDKNNEKECYTKELEIYNTKMHEYNEKKNVNED